MVVLTPKMRKTMKKIFTFGAIALAALATIGCNQELSIEVNPSVSGGLTEIYATREANTTKTTWLDYNDPTKVVWGAQDQLSVFSTDNPQEPQNLFFYTTTDAYNAYRQDWTKLTFTYGSAEIPGTAPYWSIFPYNRSNAMVNGSPKFPFMYNQTARAHYFDAQAFAAAAYSQDMNFNFQNLFGLLEIKVGELNVTSVTLKSNKQGDAFGSEYTVVGFSGQLGALPNNSNVEEITLTPDEGTFTVGETYYMVVPPKEFTEGATLSMYSGSSLVAALSTSGAVEVERNKVHMVPVLTVSEPPVPSGNTVSEIVAQITSTSQSEQSAFSVDNLAGAVVSYVNGNNAYLEDASGAILIYIADNGLSAGDIISGPLSGNGYKYNGLPEITSFSNEYTKTTGGTIPLTEMTLSQLTANHAANLSRRVLVKGVTITDGISDGDRNGTITQGDDGSSYPVYAQLKNSGLQLNKGDIGDLILFVGVYNTTNQLLFWDNAFFTKTGAITNLTVSESLSVAVGSTKTISVETNSDGAVSFKSSNTAVATVDSKGVVTGVAAGSATITVSVAASGYYTAIQKTCAVTVTAASSSKQYVLTSEDIKAAHTVKWNYTDNEAKTITAADGSEWIAYNTYGNANQVTIQMNVGKGSYVLTPKVSTKITKLTLELATKADGTGVGTRSCNVCEPDGTLIETVTADDLIAGYELSNSYTQLRIEPAEGATYIPSITVDFQ